MFSYIFMKILESRPHRYDWGIDFITKGQAGTIKEQIVTNFVRSDMAILDVGCGTGDLAVRAARAGAFVTGVDISEGMLAVAQERVKKNGLEKKVVLHHSGVVEMDSLFDEKSFELIHRGRNGTISAFVPDYLLYFLNSSIAYGIGSNLSFTCLLQKLFDFAFGLDSAAI